MRGKADLSQLFSGFRRITPAYAGKRFRFTPVLFGLRDHPRLCGEKGESVKLVHKHVGSPPPMRGKAAFAAEPVAPSWITPAYAGKRETP